MAKGKTEELTRGFGYRDRTQEYGKITDEAVQALASRIGVERSRGLHDWEREDMRFTAAQIRRIAMGQGDTTPCISIWITHGGRPSVPWSCRPGCSPPLR